MKILAFSFLVTLAGSVILVPGMKNSLKDAIENASVYDIIKLMAGNFTIDIINLSFPLSIFGPQNGTDGRDRNLPVE